ncbi:MAG TPA: hypothetical protein VMT85_01700 [Thermoanaerobaculia bacterium]|nr:hypothetical protein [Thermoanaerobaculia bacterium]
MRIVRSGSGLRLASFSRLRSVPSRLCAMGSTVAPALALLLLAGACVDLEQVLRVRSDGAGELLVNVRFDPKLLEEGIEEGQAGSLEEMLAEMRQNAAADGESQAAELGEGVRFAGIEELTGERPGLQLRFDFDDVGALRLSPMGPLSQAGGAPGAGSADPMGLAFDRKGKRSTLRVALFSEEELAELAREVQVASPPESPPVAEGGFDQMAEAMMEMMKELLTGLRIAFVVEPVGEISTTNSTYRDGNRLTLFRLDFAALLENEEALKRLGAEQAEPSLAALRRMVGEVAGMDMELLPEMVVEFSD